MGRDIDAAFLGVALLHRGKEGGRKGHSGSTIMASRFFVQYNNNNGSPLCSATAMTTIESIRPSLSPSPQLG